jgi:hypothetical protein
VAVGRWRCLGRGGGRAARRRAALCGARLAGRGVAGMCCGGSIQGVLPHAECARMPEELPPEPAPDVVAWGLLRIPPKRRARAEPLQAARACAHGVPPVCTRTAARTAQAAGPLAACCGRGRRAGAQSAWKASGLRVKTGAALIHGALPSRACACPRDSGPGQSEDRWARCLCVGAQPV